MREQAEQQQMQAGNAGVAPARSSSRCVECGEVDQDVRSGATICRRCVDTEVVALPAHTD